MRCFAQIVSWIALAVTILPSILFLAGTIDIHLMNLIMLMGTAGWFIITPFWMGRKNKNTGVES